MSTDLTTKDFSANEIALIKNIAAPKCTDDEFKLLLYQAQTYNLDPLLKQIWAVKYSDNKPASIFAGRDGFLAIAHRSGAFDGMESGFKQDGTNVIGWAKVYRKDMSRPFSVEVNMKEYNRNQGTWLTHATTMIVKVAEAQALRKAFQISGIYSPDEMPEAPKPPMREVSPLNDIENEQSHEGMVLIKDPEFGDKWIPDKSKKKK
ncbi:MAG: phage recombination protein Bet [Proteiniphilum sp.]|nr:phage recombination protein Bet [Proteiniphilum sp.]